MSAEAIAQLRRSFDGAVIGPSDSGYNHLRRPYNALIDRRPALIARCWTRDDVAAALAIGQEHGLEIAVRGGGHNPAGHCAVDDGLVVDLSLMRRVDVDPGARVARSQGGATWLDFDRATQAHGLVTPGGVVGTTGVTGLTLGGGIGHLTAQFGLTCDGMLGAEVITPAGEVVRAGPDGDEELLWGLRGGGGNFGVATEIELRLHPLERVLGGRLVYGDADLAGALRAYREVVASAPNDLSCTAMFTPTPDGQLVMIAFPCYTGSDAEPEGLRRLREAPGLVEDGVRAHSFMAQQHMVNPDYGVDRTYWKGHFVRELGDELVDLLVERMRATGRKGGQILIESLHGAAKETGSPSTAAVGFREAAFNLSAMGAWDEPADDEEGIAWTRETAAVMEPWTLTGGGYVNYMQADEPIERVRAAFGADAFDRLQALKGRYDPGNVLRRNQNVPPPRG